MKEPSQHTEDYLNAPVYTSKMSPQEFLQSKNEEAMGPVYNTPVSPQEFLETKRQVEMGPVYKSKMPPDQFIAMQEERVIYEMDPLIQNQIIYNRPTGDGGQFVLMADGQSYNVSSKGEFFRAPLSGYDQQQMVKEAQEYFNRTHTEQGPTRTATHVPPAMMGGAGHTSYEYGVMTPPQVPDDFYYHDPTELSDTPMTKEELRALYIEPYEDKEPVEKEFRYPTLRGAAGMSAGAFKETVPQPGKPLPGSLPLRGFMQLYGEYKRQTGHPGGADLVARVTGQPRGLGDSLQRALYDPKVMMEAIPFVGRFVKSALLWNIKNRVRDNKATMWEHAILQQEAASQEQDVSIGGRVADISIPMPGFMAEMAFGSKLFGAAGPAFKGAKGMLVGGKATGATGRIYDAIVKKTGKELLGWTGSTVGHAALQSATSSLSKSVAHALDRNAPVIGFRDDGSYGYIEDGEPLINALFKGYLDEAVEVWSEQFGDMLLQLPGIRNLSEIEQGYLRRLAQKDGDGFLKRFAEGYTTLAGQTHFSTGILGQFAEHAEELTGDLLRYTFGLDDDYDLPTKDEWIAQTISFLLPGSVGAASTAHGVMISKQARDFRRGQRISKSIDKQQAALKEEAERRGITIEELRREQGIDPVVDIVTKRLPGVEVSEETTVDVGGREMTGRLVTRKDGVRMLITADETVGTPTTLGGKTNYLRSAAEMPGGGPVIALLREQASKAVESGDAALIESTFDTLYEELGGAKSTPGVSLTFLDSPNQKSVELTSLIRLADDLDDTSKKITFDHELAHHLLKAFATEREWAMVEKGYLGPDGMINEDIFANKYQMVARDRDLVMEHGSTMDKLMLRFRDWLDEIRDNIREFFGRGPTEYDVMRRMHGGEVGAREMVSQETMAKRGASLVPDMQAKEQAAAQWADTMAESVVAEDATAEQTPVVKEDLTTPTVKESLTVADDPAVAIPEGLADVGHPYDAPEYSVQSPIERFQKANKLPVGEQYAVVAHGTNATLQPEPGFPNGRLRLDYIGQGEGGQAYMWGIYLAQAMETGGVYRASVTNQGRARNVRGDLTLNRKETPRHDVRRLAREYSRQHNIDGYLYSTITDMLSEGMDKAEIESRIDLDKLDPADSIEAAALSFIIENNIELADKNIATGSLYTFDVPDAALERVILWDKSLGEQHEMVRPVLEAAFKEWGIEYKGGAVGNAIHGTQLKRKAGSEWFREHGVVGNMYLDAGSRYEGEGTYNIVIWDQDVLNDVIPLTRNGEELSREGIAPERLESIRAQEADPDRQLSLAKANEMVPGMSLSTVYALGFATARSAVENIGGKMTTVDVASSVFGPTPAIIIPFENYDIDSRLINFLRDRNWLFYDKNTMIPYKERGITQGLDAQYESEYPGLRALETYFEVALYDRASGDFVGLINTGGFISDANKAILDKHGVTYREVESTPAYSVQKTGAESYRILAHGTSIEFAPEPGFPHGRFSLDKIKEGETGEGSLIEGWGIYLAEEVGLGEWYREWVSGRLKMFPRKPSRLEYKGKTTAKGIAAALEKEGVRYARATVNQLLDAHFGMSSDIWAKRLKENPEGIPAFMRDAVSHLIDNGLVLEWDKPGSVYVVDNPEYVSVHMEWNKPIVNQTSPTAARALREAAGLVGLDGTAKAAQVVRAMWNGPFRMKEEGAHRTWERYSTKKRVSEWFRERGVTGNKYLDYKSKNLPSWEMDKAEYNYVIWDQNELDSMVMLERNGEELSRHLNDWHDKWSLEDVRHREVESGQLEQREARRARETSAARASDVERVFDPQRNANAQFSVQPLLESSPSHSKGSTQAALRRSGAYSTNPITGQGTLNYSVSNFYQWKMGAYKEFNETVEAIKAIESKKNQTREDKKTLKELNKKLESLKELRDPKLVNALKALELSDKVIDAYFDWLESWYHQIKRFIEEHPDSIGSLYADTDKVATQGVAPSTRKAVKGTSGYMLSLDITGICAKRQDAQRFLEAVQDSLADQNKDSALTPIEQEMILLRLVQKGYERMCVVCYVETLRALKGKTAGNFIRFLMGEEFKKGDEGYIGSMSGERARGIREALRPEVEAGTLTYNDFDIRAITEEKGKDAALADPDHNIHKYPEAYKAAWDAANHNASAVLHSKPYEGNLRQLTQKQHDRMWITGGMRIFSQSDLLFEHLFDIIQALTDMSGRPAHNYTKEKWMPRVFGDTGLKMNLSLIGLFDKDGNMTPWNTNTYPWDDAFEMRKKHGDVGTILVALNDEAIYWGMNNDEIDQMIGFHASGMYTPQRKALERLTNIKNYEEGATVIIPEGAGLKYDDGTPVLEIKVPREQDAFFFSKEGEKRFQKDWGEKFKGVPLVEKNAVMSVGWVLEKDRGYTNQEILEAYLEAARKYQFIPQFGRFVWDQKTGELQPGAAKLIKDYARTDTPNRGVDATKVDRDAIREMQAEWLDQKTNPSESRSTVEGKERALVDAMLKDIEYWRSKERSPENIQEMMNYLMQEQHGVALEGATDADLSEGVPLPKQASPDFAVTPEHMTPLERDIQEGKDSPGVPRLAIAEQSDPARTAAQNIDVAMYKDFESMPDTELQALADKVDLKGLEPKVMAGEVLTAPETLAGIRLLEQSWQDYSKSGTLADMRRHIALHEGWRRGGTDLARRMRARADKLKTPQERFEHAMAMLHGKPSEKMKQLTERLGEEGISDADRAGLETQLEAELERMAAENARINDMLARYGLFAHEISKKLQTLNDNIDLLEEQLQQAEAERGSVAEAEEAAAQSEADIEKIKADHEKELEKLRDAKNKAQRRRREAQRALNEARKDSNAQATQAARERAKKAEGDASRAERKAERAQAQLDEARKTNSDRIKEAERAAKRAQAELERTQKHLEKTAAAYEKAKNRIRELESDLVTAKRKEQQAKDALGRAREVYERQLNKAREARNKAQADLRNAKAREFRLEQKVIDLKSKLDDVRYRLRQAQRQAKDMIKGTFGAKTYTWGDVMYEYWLSGLLSGPRTHMVNTLSNVVHLAWDMGVQRTVEAAVNSIANKEGAATFGELAKMWRQMLPGLRIGLSNAREAFYTGEPVLQVQVREAKQEKEEGESTVGYSAEYRGSAAEAKLGRGIGSKMNLPSRMLQALDELTKGMIGHLEATALAYRAGLAEGIEGSDVSMDDWIQEQVADKSTELWDAVLDTALRLSFQTELGPRAKELSDVIGETQMKWLAPFRRTPTNIVTTGFRKTPWGLLSLAKRWNHLDNNNKVRLFSEQLMAWTIQAAMIATLVGNPDDEPWITGNIEYDSQKAGATGVERRLIKPRSIRIGGRWREYGRIEPFGIMLAHMADIAMGIRDHMQGKPGGDVLGDMISGQIDGILSIPMIQGLADFYRAATGDVGDIANWGTSFATSFVWNIVRQPLRSADPVYRDQTIPRGEHQLEQRLNHLIYSALPYGRHIPRFTPYGEEVRKVEGFSPLTDAVFRMLAPLPDVTPDYRDPVAWRVDKLLFRWNRENWDEPQNIWGPALPDHYIEFNGERHDLTDKQYEQLIRQGGAYTLERLGKLKLDHENPTERDVKRIKRAFENGYSRARNELRSEIRKAAREK